MTIGSRVRTVAELAEICGAEVEGDPGREVRGPAGLDEAGPDEVSFLAQPKYAMRLATTRAGAVLVGPGVEVDRDDFSVLRCADPEAAFNFVVVAFAPDVPDIPVGIAASAAVHASATVAPDARVGEHVSVGEHAFIGPGATLHPGVRVGAHAKIGAGSLVYPNVVLYAHCEVGERCILHAGTILGSDGFGFRPEKGGWVKTPQVGNVVVEDDVEIGSNVSIDCARFGSTRIGAGTKIDNLVHIAHNVTVGRGTLLLGQCGIAGSSSVGDGVIIAGQAGIAGHTRIGHGVRILGGTGITKDVPDGEEWFGYPGGPRREKMRRMMGAERAGDEIKALKRRLKEMEAQLEQLAARGAGGASLGTSGESGQ